MRLRASTLWVLLVSVVCALAPGRARGDDLPIPVLRERLDNGLRVVLSPDHTSPTVAVEVFYDVGARVEAPGHTGYAHLLEHLMFEGSANVDAREHFRLVTARGGTFNGRTHQDRTRYSDFLPSNALALGLFLEADRMRGLSLTQRSVDVQREVVLEERRQSYENRPYMMSYLRRDELVYDGYFPYAHSTLGDVDDLRRATVDDVRAFYARYYAPDNAVLAIVGDFDAADAMALVRRYFGAVAPGHAAPWQEPAWTTPPPPRRESVVDPLARASAFHAAWRIPPRGDPDHRALDLLAIALGDGQSARLVRSMVREREVASTLEVDTDGRRGPDMFTVWCVLAGQHTADEALSLLDREVDDIARHGVNARELEKVRNLLRRRFVIDLQGNLLRARLLAQYELFDGDATLLRSELDRYLAVTSADIQRVARQYLAPQRRVVLDVRPAP